MWRPLTDSARRDDEDFSPGMRRAVRIASDASDARNRGVRSSDRGRIDPQEPLRRARPVARRRFPVSLSEDGRCVREIEQRIGHSPDDAELLLLGVNLMICWPTY